MEMHLTRRSALAGIGAVPVVAAVPGFAVPRDRNIRFGYTAMTWGNDERQGIDDISALGFRAYSSARMLLRSSNQLKDLLSQHKLTFVALSSGDVSLDAPEAEQIA